VDHVAHVMAHGAGTEAVEAEGIWERPGNHLNRRVGDASRGAVRSEALPLPPSMSGSIMS